MLLESCCRSWQFHQYWPFLIAKVVQPWVNEPKTRQRTTPKEGIRSSQPRPRELRNLDRRIIPLLLHKIHRFRHILSNDSRGSSINKVLPKNLRHEWE